MKPEPPPPFFWFLLLAGLGIAVTLLAKPVCGENEHLSRGAFFRTCQSDKPGRVP